MLALYFTVIFILARASSDECKDDVDDCTNPQALKNICKNSIIARFCSKSCHVCGFGNSKTSTTTFKSSPSVSVPASTFHSSSYQSTAQTSNHQITTAATLYSFGSTTTSKPTTIQPSSTSSQTTRLKLSTTQPSTSSSPNLSTSSTTTNLKSSPLTTKPSIPTTYAKTTRHQSTHPLASTAAAVKDPCLNHTVIYEPHRSTQFVPDPTDPLICDSHLLTGWYAFSGSAEIPNRCVKPNHCGTRNPVWLNGTFPSVADGIVRRQVCGIMQSRNSTFCCGHFSFIRIKNCGTFYVYNLIQTPECPMAYCAGNIPLCKNGYSVDGSDCIELAFEKQLNLYPKLTSAPNLQNPEKVQSNAWRFPCVVHYDKLRKDAIFDVTWTVDGKPLIDPGTKQPIKSVLTGNARIAYLDVNKLQGQLDKTLRCSVSSHFYNTPNLHSDFTDSNGYYVGIKISSPSLAVDEKGEDKEITVTSTLPFSCDPLDHSKCGMQIDIQQKKDHNDLSWNTCVAVLQSDKTSIFPQAKVKVKATRDFINDRDKTQDVDIKIDTGFVNINPVWKGYKVSNIQIDTKDRATASCTLTGDLHMRGFVHKKNYNVYDVGEFLLYGTKHNGRPFEVHIRNWDCGRLNPCTCAIAAREGNDVVEIDMCPNQLNQIGAPVTKKLSSGPLGGTTVFQDVSGKHFYINFASGTRIQVDAFAPNKIGYLNVHIQAPEDDIDKTEGICGAWFETTDPSIGLQGKDGVMYADDHIGKFVSSWKLPNGTSLFEKVPKHDPNLELTHQYCSCSDKGPDCTKGRGANNPSKTICDGGKCIPAKLIQKTKKRSYMDDYADRTFPDINRFKKHARRDARFPTPSGITDATARTMCLSAFQKSSIYNFCQPMKSLQMESFIDACIEDIKYADGDLFTIGHVSAFETVCQTETMKNPSHIDANGNPVPPPEITSGRCPNQCSLQGACVAGVCHCNQGYTSADCSVKNGMPPEIHELRGLGLCDIRSQPCVSVKIIADNVMDSGNLMCKVVFQDENGLPTYEFLVNAEFISFLEVKCYLPSHKVIEGTAPYQKLQLSLTNDGGSLFSAPKSLTIFDSHCYQCTKNGSCSKKPDSCLINGQCFKDGEKDMNGNTCSPSNNPSTFVTVPYVLGIDHFTASFTGCPCVYNPSQYDCACCQNGGCQCGPIQKNQCTPCQQMNLCGKFPHLFPRP